MFFDIFLLILAFNGLKASIENMKKSNEINCSKENSIINVTLIKDVEEKEFPVHIKFCKNGKIDYNTFTLSEENCFTLSGQPNEQHQSIYCFPVKEMSQNYRISRPKDDFRTRKGIQFEYCGKYNCCENEELSSKGYKCLVNKFGEFGFYQARYWKIIPTTSLIQIDKAQINHNIIKRGRGRQSAYSSGYRQSRFSNRPAGHGDHYQPSQSSNDLPNTPEDGHGIGADNTPDNGLSRFHPSQSSSDLGQVNELGTGNGAGAGNGLGRFQTGQSPNNMVQSNELETGNGIGAGSAIDGGVENEIGRFQPGQSPNNVGQFNELEAGNGAGASTTTGGGVDNDLDRYQPADNETVSNNGVESDAVESDAVESDTVESDRFESDGVESDGAESDGVESDDSNNDGEEAGLSNPDRKTNLNLFASDIFDGYNHFH